jgi:ribosomal protein S18 acetylase RimI-like enzyme
MQPSRRAAIEADKPFLYSLYREAMHDLIDTTWGWDEAWQQGDFDKRFNKQIVSIVEIDSRAVGSLWTETLPNLLYISMILVTPEFQGQGIGTVVMRQVLEEAAAQGLPAGLSVLELNPRARLLYERLGFKVTATESPFIRMRRDLPEI